MRWLLLLPFLTLVIQTPVCGVEPDELKLASWHHWRGPLASGVAPKADPPVTWGSDRNIQWKAEIPGVGSSTPIVWGDQVYVVSSVKTEKVDPSLPKPEDQPRRLFGIKYPNTAYRFEVFCFDRSTGEQRWRKTAAERVPHEGHHPDNNFASASPTTDGERLYVWFGSIGLFCYDLKGELQWQRDLGKVNMRRSFGEGCSPVVHDGRLVLNRDNDGDSYLVVMDAKSGEQLWRAERDETSTWATPLIVQANGRTQVIVNASNRVRSYDLKDGSVIWECGGQVANVTPSPVTSDGLVFCMSGYRGSALYAIPLDASGDISDSDKIAWKAAQGTPYVPSPVLYDGQLYFNQSNNAILTSLDAKTGKPMIARTRMPELRRIYASPVAAAGRIYFVGRDGTTLVLKHGGDLNVLATNRIGEDVDASPAIAGKQLFLRAAKHLYCIASP